MNITEDYLKEHFINAYFVDNERTQIGVLTTDPDDKKVIETIIEYDMEHPWCKALFSIIDLDQLHEETYQKIKNERREFEDMVVNIAKKEGLIFDDLLDGSKVGVKSYPLLVNTLFEENENEDHLFALKLALFESPKIKDSTNDDLKKKLRQGKTKIDVLKAAIEFMDAE